MEDLHHQINEILQLEEVPLSDTDLRDLMDGRCSVHLYRDIKYMKNIKELLGPYDCAMILYEWQDGYGHWVCLSKHGKNIEYFDPYGYPQDWWLDFVPVHFRKESNQDHTYLTRLLAKCKYDVEYNDYPFQEEKKGISTCGRWSTVRGILKDLPLDEFKAFFLDPEGDKIVTLLTSDLS